MMERGRNQVLFHFMPEQVADYITGAIGKVERCRARPIIGVDMGRLLEAIQRSAGRFGDRAMGFPRGRAWNPDDFAFLEPTSIELELFPLTFFCKKCGIALQYDSIDEFREATRRVNFGCPVCRKGALEQTEIVHYHTCGKLETLVVRSCSNPNHGSEYVYLDRGGSGAIRDWWWRCRHPDHGGNPQWISRVGARCFDHQKPEIMSHNPFRTGEVYYPESVAMVNVPPLVPGGRPDEITWSIITAEYLGITPAGTLRRLASGEKGTTGAFDREEARRRLLASGIPREYIDAAIKALGLPPYDDEIEDIVDKVRQLVSLTGEPFSMAASKVYEYLEITKGPEAKSIAKAITQARGPQVERIRSVPQKMKELGLGEACVTTTFPLVKAIYGFSRGDPTRKESTLRAFPGNEDFKGKIPIYGVLADTEAIIISLDRARVHTWLRENGFIGEPPITDDQQLKAWFLSKVNLQKTLTFEDIDSLESATKWVYRLTHSLSHLLLRQAASIAGIDRNSLGEVLFPNVPAFAIYTGSSEGFSLGGMYTLFETSMASWLEAASEEARYCLNDPVCIEGDKACFACLHLAEVSCEHFNREIGRDTILGAPSGPPRIGYWSGVQ